MNILKRITPHCVGRGFSFVLKLITLISDPTSYPELFHLNRHKRFFFTWALLIVAVMSKMCKLIMLSMSDRVVKAVERGFDFPFSTGRSCNQWLADGQPCLLLTNGSEASECHLSPQVRNTVAENLATSPPGQIKNMVHLRQRCLIELNFACLPLR